MKTSGNTTRRADAVPIFDPALAGFLETIYQDCNRPARLERDPLAIVKRYEMLADREIAGLICSTLAFGAVDLIMRACETALASLGDYPAQTLADMDMRDLRALYGNFQYRFCFSKDMIALLGAAGRIHREHGSLAALLASCDRGEPTLVETASRFVREFRAIGASLEPGGIRPNLLPDPADGSSCKRLFLWLRWMVRHDDIDPGGWEQFGRERLIVPLDLHMTRTCVFRLGFLPASRAAASPTLRDAVRVTDAFRVYAPDDPVKYDFALTRPGIDPKPGDEQYGCL